MQDIMTMGPCPQKKTRSQKKEDDSWTLDKIEGDWKTKSGNHLLSDFQTPVINLTSVDIMDHGIPWG